VQRVAPSGAKKPQNRPLSKLNTGRFVLRAMLPVNIFITIGKKLYGITVSDNNKLQYLNRISQFFAALKLYNSSILATFSDDRGGLKNTHS